jgi:hypothetical protein
MRFRRGPGGDKPLRGGGQKGASASGRKHLVARRIISRFERPFPVSLPVHVVRPIGCGVRFSNRQTLLCRHLAPRTVSLLDRCTKSTEGKVFLDADNVGSSFELFCNRRSNTRNPNLQFGIRIERSGRLNAELSDTPIENAMVGHLRASESLLIDHD